MLSNFEIKKGEVKILTRDKMSIKAFQTANAFIGRFFCIMITSIFGASNGLKQVK